jgi:hypothetical protein
VRTNAIADPCLPIHYPTVNLAHYLHAGEEWLSVSCAQTGETPDFLAVGQGIGQAIAASDRRVLLLASGSMSHRFWPLSVLHLHEASDPIHISRRKRARPISNGWNGSTGAITPRSSTPCPNSSSTCPKRALAIT